MTAAPLYAQCQLDLMQAIDNNSFAEFGHAVSISGEVAVIGAWNDNPNNQSDAGSAYVFRNVSGTWQQEAKLTASDITANDLFGASVAISDDILVIGAYAGISLGTLRGSAYVFRFDGLTWNQEAKLTSQNPTVHDLYGYSVAIAGNRILVGDPGNTFSANSPPGRVVVYDYDGSSWSLYDVLTSSNGEMNDELGWSMAISGNRVFCGAPYHSSGGFQRGQVTVFEDTGTGFTELGNYGGIEDSERLGWAVSASATHFAAGGTQVNPGVSFTGSGIVRVFANQGISYTSQSNLTRASLPLGAMFGRSVSLEGNQLVVGSKSTSVYSYGLATNQWQDLQTVAIPSALNADDLGRSLALSSGTLIVGSPRNDFGALNSGAAYVFAIDSSPPIFVRGDVNNNSTVDISDAIWLLSFIFQSGAPPSCEKAGDVNQDSNLDLADAIYLITYFFADGPPPEMPFPNCEMESNFTTLCCSTFSGCP